MIFFITPPNASRPEREHAAFRVALHCWQSEQAAHLELDAISHAPVHAPWPTIKRAQESVARAEHATCSAIELYVDAIRTTEYPVAIRQAAVSA